MAAARSVVVTGMGIRCAAGRDCLAFSEALRSGVTGTRLVPAPVSGVPPLCRVAALVPAPDLKAELEGMPDFPEAGGLLLRKLLRGAPHSLSLSALACLEAWTSARMGFHGPRESCGIIVGGNGLHLDWMRSAKDKFDQAPEWLPPLYGLTFMDSHQVGALSELFSIHGPGMSVGGASASGNLAIREGFRLVREGEVDQCLVVGACADWSPVELAGLATLGALYTGENEADPSKACRPFDRGHRGFVFGQGSAALLLESGSSASLRGAEPLAEILSASLCLDGTHFPEPSRDGEIRAMRLALSATGLGAHEVDYVNAHGTASPLGDVTELAALEAVFAESTPWINSTKAFTGHCLSAAGAVEMVATILQMRGGFLHPNPNLDDPLPSRMRFVPKASLETAARIALSNSFGFGGFNTSILVKSRP
jgi:malonyl-ACP decarboxylase